MSKHVRFIEMAEDEARKELGAAWDIMGEAVQRAFVYKHVLHILASRDGVLEWQLAADFAQAAIDHQLS